LSLDGGGSTVPPEAATAPPDGVVSPGGVGYDINCGVRLLRSSLTRDDIVPRLREVVTRMYRNVPTGVGAHRRDLRVSGKDLQGVLAKGAAWAVANGLGRAEDLDALEEHGCIDGADPDLVSDRAGERGHTQLGTLGSGNHFAEIQYVAEIFDRTAAERFGLFEDQITVMIHSGSRGLGHQVCTDHLKVMGEASRKYGIALPDRQLACAPIQSPEGQRYLGAMAAAANFAFANRQVMTHWIRESVGAALAIAPERAGLAVVYDVCHNIAKFETFTVGGRARRLCVHRKGATRAYPDQPVLIPGDMGRYSYVMVGSQRALEQTFGSACHGAGRLMSRSEAKRAVRGRSLIDDMRARGVEVMAAGMATVAEEMPEAYKDVADVVHVVHGAGIASRVAQLRPLGVIKG